MYKYFYREGLSYIENKEESSYIKQTYILFGQNFKYAYYENRGIKKILFMQDICDMQV